MCYELELIIDCEQCSEVIQTRRDYGMCRRGREENFWGACGIETIETLRRPGGLCRECDAKKANAKQES